MEKEQKREIRQQKNQALRDSGIYTFGGELFSAITHGITALAAVAVLVISIILAVRHGDGAMDIVAVSIFGSMAFLGFLVSTIYHSLPISTGKRCLRVLDHCSIYFIIAGTYTPFSLLGIGGWVGWVIFGANWAMGLTGATLTAVNREKFKKVAFVLYLVMGWMAVIVAPILIINMGWGAPFWLLLGGGLAYTIGAVVYKMKGKYIHGIWHLFTLAGLILQFLSIMFIIIR